jgi:benzylsuccinate CoA-transferase BbsF subunit
VRIIDATQGVGGPFAATVNAGKLGVTLNLKHPRGREVALAAWADVVIESFVPGAMEKFGLDTTRSARSILT